MTHRTKNLSSQPIRVLQLLDFMPPGGVSKTISNIVNWIPSGKVKHFVASASEMSALDSGKATVDYWKTIDSSKPWNLPRYLKSLRRHIKLNQIHLIHAHQRGVSLYARLATIGLKIPVIEHVHNTFEPKGFTKYISFRGHILVACGSSIAKMLTSDFKREHERVVTIHNAAADSKPKERKIYINQAPGKMTYIMGIGRLDVQKDPVRFVEIVHEVNRFFAAKNDQNRVAGVWFGDGPLADELKVFASKWGEVDFKGQVADLQGQFRMFDLLLCTSRWEGLPLALVESASAGLPSFSADVGSCRDAIIEGSSGYLFRLDESNEAIAIKIANSISLGELKGLGRASRALYESRFVPGVFVEKLVETYRRSLEMVS